MCSSSMRRWATCWAYARSTRSSTPCVRSGSPMSYAATLRPALRMAGSTSGRYSSPCALSESSICSAATSEPPSNAYTPVLTSRIWSSSGVASPAVLASATRRTEPSPSRMTRPYVPGSSSSIVAIVAAAPLRSCASTRALSASAVSSATSPLMTTTVAAGSSSEAAAATASPVPFGSCWIATSTPSGRWSSSRRFGLSTTMTRPAPASRAACTGHAISGLPHSGWRTFGVAERMRVPSPAARITTVGSGTRAS